MSGGPLKEVRAMTAPLPRSLLAPSLGAGRIPFAEPV